MIMAASVPTGAHKGIEARSPEYGTSGKTARTRLETCRKSDWGQIAGVMKTTIQSLALSVILSVGAAPSVFAHCQVPCGIFDNNNVIQSMHVDYTTIEKASKEILALEKDAGANANQLVRWVVNKESHAQDIQEKVLNYFLAQRLKSDDPKYVEKLKLCHDVIVTAMKCKQSTDSANITKLHDLLHSFEEAFGEKE